MWVYNVNNKGFELSLKAIFTMIAGAVILLFFIQFAFDQQTVQEKVQTRTSLADLDDQLDAFAISSSHTQTLSFPQQVSLSFSCKELQLEDYARSDEKLIFAEPLETDKLKAWTQRWEFPFPIANVFYLAAGQRYVFVYDQNSFTYIRDLLIPDLFSVQKQDLRNFNAERLRAELNENPVTLVFFTSALPQGATALPQAQIVSVDLLQHTLSINGQRTFYLGDALLLGAIFGPTMYACMQEKALARLHALSTLHAQRASLLGLKAIGTCKNFLFAAQQTLALFSHATTKEELYLLQEKIIQQNIDLEKHGCPTIY